MPTSGKTGRSWLAVALVGALASSVAAQDRPAGGDEEGPPDPEAAGDPGGEGVGMFGGRTGGHRNLRALGGGGTEQATENGLEWLRRRQDPGGHWGGSPEETGLALLAFLGYGETHRTPRYGETVRAGLKYLKAVQDPAGCFGPQVGPGFPRGHAVAALAMAEAYGLTQSPLFKTSAQNGLDFLHRTRNSSGGWGTEGGDLLTSAWGVLALRSGQGGGLRVDGAVIRDSADRMARTLAARDAAGEGTSVAFRGAVLLARIFAGARSDDPGLYAEADALLARLPDPEDAEGWYFGTLAQFQVGGDRWKRWNEAMRDTVQRRLPDRDEAKAAPAGGLAAEGTARLRDVACGTMCLEVYYRYARVFETGSPTGWPSRPAPIGMKTVDDGAGRAGKSIDLSGRRFVLRGGAWWEEGIEPAADRRRVRRNSDEWFDLVRGDAVVGQCLALGRVVLRHGGEVLEVE